jgi:hypothetical protein
MPNKGSIERFIVEVPHRQHGCLRLVHLQDPLVEVAERLPGNGAAARRLELATLRLDADPGGQATLAATADTLPL